MKQSLKGRLVRWIETAQQRRADREIRRCSSVYGDSHRSEFGLELERRMMGQ